jgi:2-keto-4-pentenoate hydratase
VATVDEAASEAIEEVHAEVDEVALVIEVDGVALATEDGAAEVCSCCANVFTFAGCV